MLTYIRRGHNYQRYYQIIGVFTRHGFGSLIEQLQIQKYLPFPTPLLKQSARDTHLSPSEHLRVALEELGPTFIKLGQILSTRPDLLPSDFIEELSKLQDEVPETPWEKIDKFLIEEYGDNYFEIFQNIEPKPLGSASLAQVHPAILRDGSQVVIKVQRPGILKTIQADLEILSEIAGFAQRTSWGQIYNPVEIVAQFAFTLQNELDYRREGINADRFRANFSGEKHLYIPKIYWEYSTNRVLIMERLYGIKIDDTEALDANGIDRRQVALITANIVVKEIMEDGFFHADPHPGNFLITVDEETREPVIGAMDFGMIGYLSKTDRMNIIDAYLLSTKLESRAVVEHMLRIGAITGDIDIDKLDRDVDRMLNQYVGLPLKSIQTRRLIEELMHLAFEYRIILPPNLWLLIKTITMMDGLARELDPDVDLFAAFGPAIKRISIENRMPWVWGPSLIEELETFFFALRELPGIGERFVRRLQHGELPFQISMGANKETLEHIERISTRISLSLLTAAFILGLALLFPLAEANQIALILVMIGFAAALLLGIWIIISIFRSGK